MMKDTEIILDEFEQIYDIMCDGLKIIQNKKGFKYGTDAVLLSEFVKLKKGESVLDFCSGSGIIPLMLYSQNKECSFIGIEIDNEIVKTANKTVRLNNLEDKMKFLCGDIKNASKILKRSFDVITCNPPYSRSGSGKVSDSDKIAAARYELECTLDDVCKNAAKVLRYGGRFYIVHKAERLADVVFYLKKYNMEPKELQLVFTKKNSNAKLVLICAVLGAGIQVNVLPPRYMGEN